MRPLPLVARTRDDTNQSASAAAANPSRSSSPPPPPLREEEATRGPEGERQRSDDEEEKQPPQLLETEKLRAGIQHLLSSAPAPQQQQQQKRQEAAPRRRATPRRAAAPPSSATKKTPASASAAAAASSAGGSSSSSRPYKAQLALFSVSKPVRAPASASALRACEGNEGMEDQAPLAATAAAAASSPQCPATVLKECPSSASGAAKAAAATAAAAASETSLAANAAASGAPSPAPAPLAPPPPPPPLDPFAAYKAALNAMNVARTARATGAAGDGADASASAAVVRAAAPPQPSQHLRAVVPPPSPGAAAAAAALAAPSPLRAQHQHQHQQQAWASPGPQQNNARRLPFYPRNGHFHQPAAAPAPAPQQLPAGGVGDCYCEFSRQQEACDWADAVNRLAFAAEAAKKRAEEEVEGGGEEERRTRGGGAPPSTSTTSTSTTAVDDSRLFDYPSALPDPSLLDLESLPAAPYEPVKVFCMEVPVDNPIVQASAAAANAAGSFSSPSRPSERPTHYRKFVAASYPAFLRRYLSPIAASTGGRHFYEVLRESRPCHAYFDVEFAKQANPGADGDALVDALVVAVRAELAAVVGDGAARAALVLESDSSTASKFSRHLLIRLPGKLAFRDNAAVGRLLGEALSRDGAAARLRVAKAESGGGGGAGGGAGAGAAAAAMSSPSSDQRVAPAASRPHQAFTWVADTAVYTKNRHFRVLLSSKGGKNVALEPTSRHAHSPGEPLDAAGTTRRDLVLCSLVANVEPGTRLVDLSPGGGGFGGRVAIAGVVSGNGFGVGGAAASSIAAPRLVSREMTLQHPEGGRDIKLEWKHHAADLLQHQAGAGEGIYGPSSSSSSHQQKLQPHPRLVDAARKAVTFVERLAVMRAPGAARGDAYVRSAAIIGAVATIPTTATTTGGGGGGEGGGAAAAGGGTQLDLSHLPPLRSAVVAFSMMGPASHWCELIGRRHAGNHVYFVLDFGAGTWVQRCYDPDCAAKKGLVGALPQEHRVPVVKE